MDLFNPALNSSNMADFGDPTLFAEFEKPKGPSDRLLRQNVLAEERSTTYGDISYDEDDIENGSSSRKMRMTDNDAGRKSSSSSDDSDGNDSSDDETANEFSNAIENGDVNSQGSSLGGGPGTHRAEKKELMKTIKKLQSESIPFQMKQNIHSQWLC